MKKIVRLTESDLIRLVKRAVSEQMTNTKSTNDLTSILINKVGAGDGRAYKEICDICSKQDLNVSNPRAQKAARDFRMAIDGGENPLSNFGGGANKNSSAYKAGDALRRNLTNANDICTMIQYYSTYSGSNEDFCEAVSGELSYKLDSSTNLDLMVGKPIYDILFRFDRW